MNNMCGQRDMQSGYNSPTVYQPAIENDASMMSYQYNQNRNNAMMSSNNWNNQCMLNNQNLNNMQGTNSSNMNRMNNNMSNNTQTFPIPIRNNVSNTVSFTPETLTNIEFMPAYLHQHIGKWIRAEFFFGDAIEQRVGILVDVGATYIIIQSIEPATIVVCDIFSIKFVTIVLDNDYHKLIEL